jgi:hypothetical protein
MCRQVDSGPQACNAAADDEEVRRGRHRLLL